ncbi:TonB-dependent receptor [Caenibius sp. WL]|uniref:TonB-dependent receptor n=1 Tax=Caenibius sp. WL TaxID=2872646 RepID=UPI001C99E09F|nr:TonB-dependent receptor [Caenibius sp. WL]QZP07678.1 TonB-dependent receptor [Caenibius sp. WL]
MAAVLAAGGADVAWAQEAAEEVRPAELSGEIIVTATRRNEALRDVPMSVNVATGEQLEKLNILDVSGVQQLAPGLELTNNSGRNNTTTLRGVSFDPDSNTSPAVRVYYNEAPADAQTVYTAIYDIQQIEVLRGPQGLLRGLSAPAGSITITTRRPSFDKAEGYVQGTVTLRDGYNLQGGVSVPLSEKFAIRVAGLIDGNRINQVRNVNRGDQYSKGRTESFRATLGMQPTDTLTAYLTYQYLHARNRQYQQVVGTGNHPSYLVGCYFAPSYCGGSRFVPDTSESSGPPLAASDYRAVSEGEFVNDNKSHLVNLNVDWDMGPATLAFIGAYQYSVLNTHRDNDDGNAVPNYIADSYVKSPYKVWTGELRLTSNNDEGLGWGLGAFYTKQTGTTVVRQPGDSFFFPVSVASSPDVIGDLPYLPIHTIVTVPIDRTTWSFNANLRYKSGPLKIEGGIRYSIIKSIHTTQLGLALGPNVLANYPSQVIVPPYEIISPDLQKLVDKPITGGLNITYEISPTLNVYAAYGHSFRAGTTGVITQAGLSSDILQAKGEKTDSYEVGFKGSLADRRIDFSVAAFYQKLNGFINRFNSIYWESALDPSGSGFLSANYNGDAKIKGVEAEVNGRITKDWDVGINASYAHARYSGARLPCNDFDGSGIPNQNGTPTVQGDGNVSYCISNSRLAEMPDFNLSANTELRFPMGNIVPFVRGIVSYRPGFYSDRADFKYPSRTLLNLYAGIRSEDAGWEFNVFVKNVLNQKRITNTALGNFVQATSADVAYDSGYRLVNTMNPREAGLTASYKF